MFSYRPQMCKYLQPCARNTGVGSPGSPLHLLVFRYVGARARACVCVWMGAHCDMHANHNRTTCKISPLMLQCLLLFPMIRVQALQTDHFIICDILCYSHQNEGSILDLFPKQCLFQKAFYLFIDCHCKDFNILFLICYTWKCTDLQSLKI